MAENDVSIWVADDDKITVTDMDKPGCVIRFGEFGSLVFLKPDAENALREMLVARQKILRFPARPRPRVAAALDEIKVAKAAAEEHDRWMRQEIGLPEPQHINGPFGPDVA